MKRIISAYSNFMIMLGATMICTPACAQFFCKDMFEATDADQFVEDAGNLVVRMLNHPERRTESERKFKQLLQEFSSKIGASMTSADKAIVDLAYFSGKSARVEGKWERHYNWENLYKKNVDAYNLKTFDHSDSRKFIPDFQSSFKTFPPIAIDRSEYAFDIVVLDCTTGH